MSNEITLYDKFTDPLAAIERLGQIFTRSCMFGAERPEAGMVLAMTCLTERKTPTQILREYHIIDGRLSDRADSMLAKFRAKGGKHEVLQRDGEASSVKLTLDGQTLTFTLTHADVKVEPFYSAKDGKPKRNWATPRARMQTLWARVISDGVRTMAPEIVAGIYTPEEIQDIEPEAVPAKLLSLSPAGYIVPRALPEAAPAKPLSLSPAGDSGGVGAGAPPTAQAVQPGKIIDLPAVGREAEAQTANVPSAAPTAPPGTSTPTGEAVPPQPAPRLISEAATGTPATGAAAPAASVTQMGLTAEQQTQLAAVLAPVAGKVLKWFAANGWLKPGQAPEDIDPGKAASILRAPKRFVAAVTSWKEV